MTFAGRFVRSPELFPARRAGEPWGGDSLELDVPGGPFRVVGLAPAQTEALRRLFGSFVGGERPDAFRVEIFRVETSEFDVPWVDGTEYTLDLDAGDETLRVAGMNLMALVDWRAGAGALWVSLDGGEYFAAVFENLLRVVVAYRLLQQDGVLLHAAALVRDDRVLLFPGHSGSGKTTLSRLAHAEGAEVLSDDLVAVLAGKGTPVVVPTPFGSEFRGVAGPPRALEAIVALRKGAAHGLAPRERSSTVAALVACAPTVNRDPLLGDRLLLLCGRLADAVPSHVFAFTRGPGLWHALQKGAAA